jgi:hypothetical protein
MAGFLAGADAASGSGDDFAGLGSAAEAASSVGLDRTPPPCLRLLEPVALAVQLENMDMMREAIEKRASEGGPGSGNRWRYGVKSATDDYRTLDVRRWALEGVLTPGYWGGWQWTRDGETVASIQMRAEQDRVILIYRHRSGDAE